MDRLTSWMFSTARAHPLLLQVLPLFAPSYFLLPLRFLLGNPEDDESSNSGASSDEGAEGSGSGSGSGSDSDDVLCDGVCFPYSMHFPLKLTLFIEISWTGDAN